MNKCLSIKGAEDAINKPHAFEISTTDQNMYFIADSDKVREGGAQGRKEQPPASGCMALPGLCGGQA